MDQGAGSLSAGEAAGGSGASARRRSKGLKATGSEEGGEGVGDLCAWPD